MTLDLQGWLSVACDRCLDPMRVPVDTVYELKVKYGYEFDDSTEGLLILPENQPDLDLAPLLYDTAILSIPMRCVHPEGECNKAMSELLEEHDLQDADVSDADDEIPDPDRN